MPSLSWQCLHHRELDTATLYALLALRTQVFVGAYDGNLAKPNFDAA